MAHITWRRRLTLATLRSQSESSPAFKQMLWDFIPRPPSFNIQRKRGVIKPTNGRAA